MMGMDIIPTIFLDKMRRMESERKLQKNVLNISKMIFQIMSHFLAETSTMAG